MIEDIQYIVAVRASSDHSSRYSQRYQSELRYTTGKGTFQHQRVCVPDWHIVFI